MRSEEKRMFGETDSDSSDSDWLYSIVRYSLTTAEKEQRVIICFSEMDLGLEGAGAQEFFDELSEDDHMPGVEEAEEAKDGKKKKATAGKFDGFWI